MHESTLLRHSRDPVMHQRQYTRQQQQQLEKDISVGTLVFDDEDCDENETAQVTDSNMKPNPTTTTTTRGLSEQDRTSSHGWSRGSVTDLRVGDRRPQVPAASDVIHRGPSIRLIVPENYFSSRKYHDSIARHATQRYAAAASRVYPVHRVQQPLSRQAPVGLDFERHRRIEKWLESSAMALTRGATTGRDVMSSSQRHVTDTAEHRHGSATDGFSAGLARPDRRQQQQQQQQQQPIDSAQKQRYNNNDGDYTRAAAANKPPNNEVHQSLSRRRETSNNRDRHTGDSVGSDWSSDVINLAGSTAGSDSYSTDFTPFEFDHQRHRRSHQQQQQQQQQQQHKAEPQQVRSRTRHEQPSLASLSAAAAASAADGPFVARIVIKTGDTSKSVLKTDGENVAFPVISSRGADVKSNGNSNSGNSRTKRRDLGPSEQHNQQTDTRQQEAANSTHTVVDNVNNGGDTNFAVPAPPVVAKSTVAVPTAVPVTTSVTPTNTASALTDDLTNVSDSNQNLSEQRGKKSATTAASVDKEFMKKYCLEKLIYASAHQVASRHAANKFVPSLLADAEPDILKSHKVSYPPEIIERVPSGQQTEVDKPKSQNHRASYPLNVTESVSYEKQIDVGSSKTIDNTCHQFEEKHKNTPTSSPKDACVITKSPGCSSTSTSGGHVTKINVASSGHSKTATEGLKLKTQSPGGSCSGATGDSAEFSAGSKYTVNERQPIQRRASAASHAPGLTVFITHRQESDKPAPRRPESIELRSRDIRLRSLERRPYNVASSQASSSPGLRTKGQPLKVYNNGLDELQNNRQLIAPDRSGGQFSRSDIARQSKSDVPRFSQGSLTIRVRDSESSKVNSKRHVTSPIASRTTGHSDTIGRIDQHRNSQYKQNDILWASGRHAIRTPVATLNRDASHLSAAIETAPRHDCNQEMADDRHQFQTERYAKHVSSSPKSENSDSWHARGSLNSRYANDNMNDFLSNSLSSQSPNLRVEQSDFSHAGTAGRTKQSRKSAVTTANDRDIAHDSAWNRRVSTDEFAAKQSSWQRFECSSSCSGDEKESTELKQPSPMLMQRSSSESSSISTTSSDHVQQTPYVMLTDDEDNLLLLDSDSNPTRPQSHDCLTDTADTG